MFSRQAGPLGGRLVIAVPVKLPDAVQLHESAVAVEKRQVHGTRHRLVRRPAGRQWMGPTGGAGNGRKGPRTQVDLALVATGFTAVPLVANREPVEVAARELGPAEVPGTRLVSVRLKDESRFASAGRTGPQLLAARTDRTREPLQPSRCRNGSRQDSRNCCKTSRASSRFRRLGSC